MTYTQERQQVTILDEAIPGPPAPPLETVDPETQALVDKHHAFKVNAATILQDKAHNRGLCSDFERVMHVIHLPGRESHVNVRAFDCETYAQYYEKLSAGEQTEEAFQLWLERASKRIWSSARNHFGNDPDLPTVLDSCGFLRPPPPPPRFRRTYQVKVTATVTVTGDYEQNERPTINWRTVRDQLYYVNEENVEIHDKKLASSQKLPDRYDRF